MMIRELNENDLVDLLSRVLESGSLEIQVVEDDGTRQVLIPYMMNDAVEYYFRFTDSSVHGEWQKVYDDSARLLMALSDSGRKCIILKNDDGDSVRIWYGKAYLEEHCYQYHRIGHAWRSQPGQERIRRLVNLLCVLHDKHAYLGVDACNPMEEKLYRLIEFAPLCYWTPIDDSIMEWYPQTQEGIRAMVELAAEAGDQVYGELIQRYQDDICILSDIEDKDEDEDDGNPEGVMLEKMPVPMTEERIICMAEELIKPEHVRIVQLLEEKLQEASLYWEPRRYSETEELENAGLKDQIVLEYRRRGYEGEYPVMHLGDESVLFVEEQPFTVMESEEYRFRIYPVRVQT